MELQKAKFEFVQEGNTLGTTGEFEKITLELEYPTGEMKDGCFFVIRTDGWSFDNLKELEKMKEIINEINV